MAEEKKVFSPAATGELLNGWLIHAHKCRDRHDAAARLYARGQYALGIPSLVVSTVVGTSVFSALASSEVPALWVGILSIAAAVFAALQTFMDFGGRSDRHRSVGVKYKAVIRLLEQLKVRMSRGVELKNDEVDSVRTLLDTLEDAPPVVMPKIYADVERKYQDFKYATDAISLYAAAAKEDAVPPPVDRPPRQHGKRSLLAKPLLSRGMNRLERLPALGHALVWVRTAETRQKHLPALHRLGGAGCGGNRRGCYLCVV